MPLSCPEGANIGSDDNETLCAVDSLRVPAGSVGRQGPGGPPRALWDSSASINGPGVKLAQGEVRACLLQSRKLKVSSKFFQ